VTLGRQLIIAVVGLFLLLYAGNLLISFSSARTLLDEQMHIHAQDAATSVALAATQTVADDDRASLEALFNVVADSGFYQRMYFVDLDGTVRVDRAFAVKVGGVPDWFVRVVDLSASEGRAEVSAGWTRLGEVVVVSHPGKAYQKLWTVLWRQLGWFTLVAAIVLVAAWTAMRVLLRPLREVENQADAIRNQQFVVQQTLPKTRELHSVVEAINRMVLRLQAIFDSQLEMIGRLQSQVHRDAVTGLSNRIDFEARVESLGGDPNGVHSGLLALVAVPNLVLVNDLSGPEAGNALLREFAGELAGALEPCQGAVVSRRLGPQFALFVPALQDDEARALAAELYQRCRAIGWEQQDSHPLDIKMVFVYSEAIDAGNVLLAEADKAMQRALSQPGSALWDAAELAAAPGVAVIKPLRDWQQFIRDSLAGQHIHLLQQGMFAGSGARVGTEIFTRFMDGEREISADIVMPMARRLGLADDLDKHIIATVADRVAVEQGSCIAVNLSVAALRSRDFHQWLADFLAGRGDFAASLVLEVPEYGVHEDEQAVRQLQSLLASRGARLAVDGFGLQASSFGYLRSLPLYYIKVHRSFIRHIDGSPDNQFYVESLLQLAHSRGITLIAEGVESEAERQTLRALGIDWMQGYQLAYPQAVH